MEKIEIGKIVNTFGLKGELKILPNKTCEKYFSNLTNFQIEKYDEVFECEKVVSKQGKFIKLKIKNYNDINQVEKFKGSSIFIFEEQKKQLEQDEYWTEDLIDCKIFVNREQIAKIVDVENFGATDIFVLKFNGKEARVPFIEEYFEQIDIKNKRIIANEHIFEGIV